MEFEKLDYIPDDLEKSSRNVWEPLVLDFINDEVSKTIVFKLHDSQEYKKCYSAISRLIRLKYHNLSIFTKPSLYQVYLIKHS